jgi:hypothetical protein
MKNEKYVTSDLYLACFLLSKNYELSGIEPIIDKPQKMNFVFIIKKSNKINDLINTFYNGKGLVSAKKYVHSIKDLKSLLYKS